MKKLNPQSALPVLFVVAALTMTFGGKRLAAIGEQIGAELSDGGRSIFALTSRDPTGRPNFFLSISDLPNQFNAIESVGAVVTEYGVAFL